MMRVVSLFLPRWATDRWRRRAGGAAPPRETPLVLAGRDGGRCVVLAVDATAAAAGLHAGMPVAQARALVPGLLIEKADPAADAAALDRLAVWAMRHYAPIAAADPPAGVIIDTTGADHLHGGETAMLVGMLARLGAAGLAARAAIADSWGAAHALARYAARPITITPPGATAEAIAPLPLAALRLSPALVAGLQTLGFVCIADLMAQPRAPLARRFGPELLCRLDQALGRLAEPISPAYPPDPIAVHRHFPEPIATPEAIAAAIAALVRPLCALLEAKGLGACRLDLICHRVDRAAQAIRIGVTRPLRDAKRLTRLLSDAIETIDPGFGIERLSLAATCAEIFEAKQHVSALIENTAPDVSDLIDRLVNRLGEDRVYRAEPVATDVPERCLRRIPPLAPETGATWPAAWPRPARLLTPPERVETLALLPDHPPVSFTWRGVRRRVACADGPERVFGEWWKRDAELAAVRDYFRIEDEAGERFWIFRAGDGENAATGSQNWFLHGIFA
ncbi:DNA polymerase Y family protein [Acidiphilium sp.]|uniref:Y-family DNA polymerase n=1 Tax=Acidiphilium sp. TaxID=527 RepID=UPI00258D2E09|nr:DNA polymerase Y family protein [Acidiphilium sp.]